MKEYTIHYYTQNQYDQPVQKGYFELTIIPCHSEWQSVQKTEYTHSLEGHSFIGKNKYDFDTLHIHTEKKFHQFDLHFQAQVFKTAPDFNLLNFHTTSQENELLASSAFQIQHHTFLKNTDLTFLNDWNIPIELRKNENENVGAYLYRMFAQIKNYLSYQSGTTTPQTTAQQAIVQGCGVCQDFSHVMIGILRPQGIPARYVSGYLFLPQQPQEAQLHAWVEVFVPYLGWKAFDPANQLMEDDNFIKIAHGRDYTDCQPIKGVLSTTGYNQTNYKIVVEQKNVPNFSQFQHQQQQ